MLLTRKQINDSWNNLSPEEKLRAEMERQRQIAEDRALEAEFVRQEQERPAQSVPYDPKNTKATSLTTRRVALRAMIASRHKIPTLWLENEAGERWVPDLANWDGAPPGFIYQWSRFPTSLRETCLRTVEQPEVDACPHTDTKPDLGIIGTMEGRECPIDAPHESSYERCRHDRCHCASLP